jgi:glutaredoxin-like protein NrdH
LGLLSTERGQGADPAVKPFLTFTRRVNFDILHSLGGMMLDTLSYVDVPGGRSDHDITVYALSTCGFCKRALGYLNAKGIAYRYVYMDQVPLATKNEAKKALKERFKEDVAFPFAIIDGDKHLVGFIEPDWAKTLGL